MTSKRKITWVLGIGILIFILCFMINALNVSRMKKASVYKAQLLESYGEEVSAIIEHYQLTLYSFEAQSQVEVLAEVASGPHLEEWQRIRGSLNNQDGIEAVVTAEVTSLVILDYTPDRFKAIANLEREFDEFSVQGLSLGHVKHRPSCDEYVFEREEGIWKATAVFSLWYYEAVLRDWDFLPEWTQEKIGEVPSFTDLNNACFSD